LNLTKSKQRNKRKKGRKLTPEEKFQHEWQRVQNTRRQNQKLRDDIAQVVAQVEPKLAIYYQNVMFALYLQAMEGMRFLTRKTMPGWAKEELLDWLDTNLNILFQSPYTGNLDMELLRETAAAIIDDVLTEVDDFHSDIKDKSEPTHTRSDEPPPRKSQQQRKHEQHREAPVDDMFEDLFSEFEDFFEAELLKAEQADTQRENDPFESEWEQAINNSTAHSDQEKALDKLLRSSNINKMFRKIARVLHPDREVDEDLKALRHDQMSELLRVRDERDIPALFSLYSEHLGSSPLEELGEDLEAATKLLRSQFETLQNEKEDIIYEHPMHGVLYERFATKKGAALERELALLQDELKCSYDAQMAIVSEMTSIPKVKELLESRIASRYDHAFGPF